MLEVLDLVSYYGHSMALGGVSFATDTGVCLVTGPNGAGKTTLLRVLAGRIEPSRGHLSLDGVDLVAERDAARHFCSYLPDVVALYADLTVSEHLTYRAQLKGFTGRRLRARIRHVVDVFDLRTVLNVRTSALSAGQRRLVGLADAFLSESRLLLLDEPFSDLDDAHIQTLCSALAVTARHAVVLVATHCFLPLQDLEGSCLVLASGTVAGNLPLAGEGLAPLRERVAEALVPSGGKGGGR